MGIRRQGSTLLGKPGTSHRKTFAESILKKIGGLELTWQLEENHESDIGRTLIEKEGKTLGKNSRVNL